MTHPPNRAKFSFPSTEEHSTLPAPHTFHVLGESTWLEPGEASPTVTDLKQAFPFVVHIRNLFNLKQKRRGDIGLLENIYNHTRKYCPRIFLRDGLYLDDGSVPFIPRRCNPATGSSSVELLEETESLTFTVAREFPFKGLRNSTCKS